MISNNIQDNLCTYHSVSNWTVIQKWTQNRYFQVYKVWDYHHTALVGELLKKVLQNEWEWAQLKEEGFKKQGWTKELRKTGTITNSYNFLQRIESQTSLRHLGMVLHQCPCWFPDGCHRGIASVWMWDVLVGSRNTPTDGDLSGAFSWSSQCENTLLTS